MVDKRQSRRSVGRPGQTAVPLYGFQPPVGTPYGLEVSTVEDFFAEHARAVAVHLGFTDPANFGRFFRGHTGLTPAAFAAREARTGS